MWRQAGKQLSLADAMVARRKGQNERLERIGALLNWGRIEQLLAPIYAAGEGRPAYRPLVMLQGAAAATVVFAVGSGAGRGA